MEQALLIDSQAVNSMSSPEGSDLHSGQSLLFKKESEEEDAFHLKLPQCLSTCYFVGKIMRNKNRTHSILASAQSFLMHLWQISIKNISLLWLHMEKCVVICMRNRKGHQSIKVSSQKLLLCARHFKKITQGLAKPDAVRI